MNNKKIKQTISKEFGFVQCKITLLEANYYLNFLSYVLFEVKEIEYKADYYNGKWTLEIIQKDLRCSK